MAKEQTMKSLASSSTGLDPKGINPVIGMTFGITIEAPGKLRKGMSDSTLKDLKGIMPPGM